MIKIIKDWYTGVHACVGSAAFKMADGELKNKYMWTLLTLASTIRASFWIVDHMRPFEGMSDYVITVVLIVIAFSMLGSGLEYMEDELLTPAVKKHHNDVLVREARKKEKKEAQAAGMSVRKYRKAKEKTAFEKAEREKKAREEALRKKAAWEKEQQRRAAQEKAEQERARRQKAAQEKARREQEEKRKNAQRTSQSMSLQKARQLLRLKETYTVSELKKARNVLMKQFHPDNGRNGSEEVCKKINEAYTLLAKYAAA